MPSVKHLRQTKIVAVIAAMLLMLIALVGFTPSSGPNFGTYISSITSEDIPASLPAEARAIFVGKWTMTLAEDHTFRIARDGKVQVEGHFASSAEQIKFTDEAGDLACTQSAEIKSGAYKWSFQNQQLTLTPLADNCQGRQFVLGIHPWAQAPKDRETAIQAPPPTPNPTPLEDTARYVEWLKQRGTPINDTPHENVSLRLGDWGFFYHGDRPVGSWTPLRDRTALDRNGHAVTEAENGDWYAFLGASVLDAAAALRRVSWLLNADGLFPETAGRIKTATPTLSTRDGVITLEGWCMAHSDPPYKIHVKIVATASSSKLQLGPAK